MASSNRHWPSMFKSKPCNPHQWQHEINPTLMSSSCHRSSYTSGCEERSPEPKPRWNPKPEQIRILEAIFNSGMVNPPRDEIKKIRAQLQEYGQVGDANVFYWFQNRKSRSKHKQRNLQTASKSSSSNVVHQHQSSPVSLTAPSSSSSSSEKTSPKQVDKNFQLGSSGINVIEGLNSPTASVNQTYFQTSTNQGGELISLDPFRFSSMVHQQQQQQELGSSTNVFTQGFCFSELSNVVQFPNQDQEIGTTTYSGLLLGELLNHQRILRKEEEEEEKMKLMQQMNFTTSTTFSTPIVTTTSMSVPSPTTTVASTTPTTTSVNDLQGCLAGVGESGGIGHSTAIGQKSTVFINDVAFEVCGGPINIRQAFGYDAVLIHSSGQPVLMDEWGVTLHSLQPGALYYLLQV